LPQLDAYGRFALSNPGSDTIEGDLQFEGRIETIRWDDVSRRLTVRVDDTLPESERRHALQVLPYEQVLIDSIANNLKEKAGQMKISFIQEGQPSIHAHWTYLSSPADVSKSFTNASSIRDNPFYLVPVFHTVQRQTTEVDPIANFRFESPVPMRLEVYDSSSGQLIYIDANGDGDWLDAGDLIAQDLDRNGIPDILFGKDSVKADVEMHFHAHSKAFAEPVELRLQMHEEQDWVTQCINRIALQQQ